MIPASDLPSPAMIMVKRYFFIAFAFFLSVGVVSAQPGKKGQPGTKIELLGAKVLKFDKALGIDAQRLIGDVRFRHEGVLMYCDSAYLYNSTNSLDAFGHVKAVQGDTLTLTGDKLYYNGNTRRVKVRDHVTLQDADMTLTTHTLDYDRNTSQAIFYDRGFITSRKNDNELVSCEGIYASDTEMFYFRDSVVLNNPDYRMETDTLNYSNKSEIAYFLGPTFIYSDENTIYCENGWYNTKTDVSQFEENAYLDNGKQLLRGDSLWYDRNAGLGRAFENVEVIDTAAKYMIRGNYGQYLSDAGQSLVTGRAEMIQYDRGDSLFLHGDTLMAIRDDVGGDRVLAYHGVRFFSADMQGAADSLVYAQNDSLIRMFTKPILWSQDLQITGDTIEIKAFGGTVDKLYVYERAFMVDRVDETKYNQIKGRRLTGYFRDNDLYKALVEGNGESLYYATEEESGDKTEGADASNGKQNQVAETVPAPTPVELGGASDTLRDILSENDGSKTIDTLATQAIKPDTATSVDESVSEVSSGVSMDSLSTAKDTSQVVDAGAETQADRKEKKAKPDRSGPKIIGVNKAVCSSIVIHLEDRKVKRIVFLTKPDGTFFPIELLPEEVAFFKGFLWEGDRRPLTRKDIFKKEKPIGELDKASAEKGE